MSFISLCDDSIVGVGVLAYPYKTEKGHITDYHSDRNPYADRDRAKVQAKVVFWVLRSPNGMIEVPWNTAIRTNCAIVPGVNSRRLSERIDSCL